jgi:hypothetical protein
VGDVGRHRDHEGLVLAAVEEGDLDGVAAPQPGRADPVHPVDHPHGLALHDDRRQLGVGLGQHPDVLGILPDLPRRVGRQQPVDRYRLGGGRSGGHLIR